MKKIGSKLFAWSLALLLFLFCNVSALAAGYTMTDVSDAGGLTLNGGDEITMNTVCNTDVYIDNVYQGSYWYDDLYTVPEGTYTATTLGLSPDPWNTETPDALYLVTVTSPEPEVTPEETPGIIPGETPEIPPEEIPEIPPTGEGEMDATDPMPSEEPASGSGHICTYKWIVTLEPTLEADGICSYMCEECDGVLKVQPISKYHAILKVIKDKLESAPRGATVKINYEYLESMPGWVVDLLDERSDLTVEVIFKSEKVWYTFTIPARNAGDKITEEDAEFYGLHFLGDKYDKSVVVK